MTRSGSHVAFNEGAFAQGAYHLRASFDFLDAARATAAVADAAEPAAQGVVVPLAVGARRNRVREREIFRRFDANGDGVLDATEIRAVAAHLGVDLASDDAEALLTLYDADKRGAVDLTEFAPIVADLEELKAKQEQQTLGSLEA